MKQQEYEATTSEANMDSMQLVASLLMCYPEVAKVVLDAEREGLRLEFAMPQEPPAETLQAGSELLRESLATYHELTDLLMVEYDFSYNYPVLTVVRDLESLTREELGLIVNLVRDSFADWLMQESNQEADEELLHTQQQLIDPRIQFLRTNHVRGSMIGVRENDRVMVYDV